MRIRPAAAGEAALLSDLAMRSKAIWGYPRAFLERCRDELTWSETDLSDLRFAVLEVGGCVVGFYALALTGDEPPASELEALFVEPHALRRGYGRLLLADAKQAAADLGAATLIVQGDPNAGAFYAACGGLEVGARPSQSIQGRMLPLFAFSLTQV